MSGAENCRTRLVMAAIAAAAIGIASPAVADPINGFTPGDLVISVYGDGDGSGTYTDNQASPITLQEFQLGVGGTTATSVGTMTLPQSQSGANYPISGEYGSSSEGTLELSADGHYLTIAGYGVGSAAFNANPASYGGTTKTCVDGSTCYPLAQTPSATTPRVIALIDSKGDVNTTTALTNAFTCP